MKKLLMVAAILVGAVSASHAGVNFSIGIGVPVPPPVIISHPAPVYCPPPPVVYHPAPVVVAPRVWAPVVVGGHVHGYTHRGHNYRYEERYRHNGHRDRYVYRERHRH